MSVKPSSLSQAVEQALDAYFEALDGQEAANLHDLVTGEVETALIRYVLRRTEGNRSRAARLLGINRNTLHRKITLYKITIDQESS